MASNADIFKKTTASTSSAAKKGLTTGTITRPNTAAKTTAITGTSPKVGTSLNKVARPAGDIPSGARTPSYGPLLQAPSGSSFSKLSTLGGLKPAVAKPSYGQYINAPPKTSTPSTPRQTTSPRPPTTATKTPTGYPTAAPQAPGAPAAQGAPQDMSGLAQAMLMMMPSQQSQSVFVGGGERQGQPLPGQADRGFTGRDPGIANGALGNYLDQIREGFWG